MASSFSLPVALTLENGFSLIATRSHMIEGAGKFHPQRTGHFHSLKLSNLNHLEPRYGIQRIICQFSRPYPYVLPWHYSQNIAEFCPECSFSNLTASLIHF